MRRLRRLGRQRHRLLERASPLKETFGWTEVHSAVTAGPRCAASGGGHTGRMIPAGAFTPITHPAVPREPICHAPSGTSPGSSIFLAAYIYQRNNVHRPFFAEFRNIVQVGSACLRIGIYSLDENPAVIAVELTMSYPVVPWRTFDLPDPVDIQTRSRNPLGNVFVPRPCVHGLDPVLVHSALIDLFISGYYCLVGVSTFRRRPNCNEKKNDAHRKHQNNEEEHPLPLPGSGNYRQLYAPSIRSVAIFQFSFVILM